MAVSKILLPHDGTKMSAKAVDNAREFAKALNGNKISYEAVHL